MFVCEECHAKECPLDWIEKLITSYGRCEICTVPAVCVDCQGYKWAKP